MAKVRQPVTIDDIEFDALLEENQDYTASIPEYTTEEGFAVSDTIALNAEALAMTLFVTDTPVTWLDRHGTGRTEEVIKKLKDLYFKHTPVTVTTNREVFSNMGIESLSFGKNVETGKAREINITLKKIRVTKIKTTTIPSSYGKSGDTEAAAGTANTTVENKEGSETEDRSVLSGLANTFKTGIDDFFN